MSHLLLLQGKPIKQNIKNQHRQDFNTADDLSSRCQIHIFTSMPTVVQSLKLRLKQLCIEYKDDSQLRSLVPYPGGDYEPQSDTGVFGKAWQDAIGACSELAARWSAFQEGAGVFDYFCEVKGTHVQVPKAAEVEEKAPPKKPSKKAPKQVEVKMRAGYVPLRASKDLDLKNFPKSIKDWVEKILAAIQHVVAARALKKITADKAAALKTKLEEILAHNKQAVAFAAAAVKAASAAVPAQDEDEEDQDDEDQDDEDAKAEGDEAEEGAMSAQGSLAQQLLLMEEQTFDAEEDDQQFKLRHGQLINYRAEEASTVLDKTKIKPTKVTASAGGNIPTLLIQVPKGMHFPENDWRDMDTLKVLKERVTCHKLDVSRFLHRRGYSQELHRCV